MIGDLIITARCYPKPLLTVELSYKWYCLYLVDQFGWFEEITFDKLEGTEEDPAFVDHVPHPNAVQDLAKKNGWHVDEVAYELMVGRWETEIMDMFKERY